LPPFEELTNPARIGLVGDTHRGVRGAPLPPALLRGLEGCDYIFHCGDVTALWVLEELARIAPARVVPGNNDYGDWVREAPLTLYFRSGRFTLALTHGHVGRGTARDNTLDQLRNIVDCAIYGHSHRPEIVEREGLLLLNPGSPTQPRWEPDPTYAILTVGDTLQARVVKLGKARRD
jgi:putative phosphoesterase